ncbi:MAG: hypothetical protein MRJ92_13080 [Nitrospira sp.]|nr:hypothetical protein [Nitrospira sp.]
MPIWRRSTFTTLRGDRSSRHGVIGRGRAYRHPGGTLAGRRVGDGGIRLREDGLVVDPHLPANWDRLSFPLLTRGRRISVAIASRDR